MKNIAVIGSGTMGNGIAHVFAQFGYKVSLIDIPNDKQSQSNFNMIACLSFEPSYESEDIMAGNNLE